MIETIFKPTRWLLLLALVLGLATPLFAQDDPFGTKDPVGEVPAETPTPEPEKRGPEKDPVVLSIRESNPNTPAKLANAVQLMLDYGRADEAKSYLLKLLEAKPDEATLAQLQNQFGSTLFLRLKLDEKLAPEGAELGEAVLKAAYKTSRDPVRLQKLVEQLRDPTPYVRQTAVRDLKRAGTSAVAPLVLVLADKERSAEHATVRSALVALGQVVVEPMIGVLETPDEALKAQAIDVLGQLGSRRAVLFLIRPYMQKTGSENLRRGAARALVQIIGSTPARYDAERFLYRRAEAFLQGRRPVESDFQGNIELWHWNIKQKTSEPRAYPAGDASLVTAARVAAELYAIAPNNTQYRRLYLMSLLEAAKFVGGLDRPLDRGAGTAHAAAANIGIEALEDLLVHAMRSDNVGAAAGAAEVLGDIGNVNQLISNSKEGRPRPLAQALRSGDLRVRMAAAEAILKIDPRQPFPGSSHLSAALGFAAKTVGSPRVLVGHPRAIQARTLAGLMNDVGYEADTATSSRDVFRQATRHPDYEFILLSDALEHPRMGELVHWLRRDPRTAKLPIGFMARAGYLEKSKRLAELHPLTTAFPRPHTVLGATAETRRLLALIGRRHVSYQERTKMASMALDRMAQLLQHPQRYSFYNLLQQQDAVSTALFTPALSQRAMKVLGLLGTPSAQHSLVEFTSANARPIKQRQSAASAFAIAVQRRGLLLTIDQIKQQYKRYNISEQLDSETQAVLGFVLDTIEAPTAEKDKPAPDQEM